MRQDYTVASGLIFDPATSDLLVLVQNRRRNGTLDWSTPGGVVDEGEQVLEALGREVTEETALSVHGWSPMLYSVDVNFVGRNLTLHAEVYEATGFSGQLHIDDPDQVVVAGRWVSIGEADALLDESPRWVAEPLRHALSDRTRSGDTQHHAPTEWRYEVVSGDQDMAVTLLSGPPGI